MRTVSNLHTPNKPIDLTERAVFPVRVKPVQARFRNEQKSKPRLKLVVNREAK